MHQTHFFRFLAVWVLSGWMAIPLQAQPVFQAERSLMSIGVCKPTDAPKTAVFKVMNVGTAPLQLSAAAPNSSALTVRYPSAPIPPGGFAHISLIFNPKNQPEGYFVSQVRFAANTHATEAFLSITGKVCREDCFYHEDLRTSTATPGKWGYINKQGQEVIEAKFDWAGNFCAGRAVVKLNNRWGFIDHSGQLVTRMFDLAWSYYPNGFAPFRDGGQFGFIDLSGKAYIYPQYTHYFGYVGALVLGEKDKGQAVAYDPLTGQAVPLPDGSTNCRAADHIQYLSYEKNGLWGLCDLKGNKLIEAFSQTPLTCQEGLVLFKKDNQYGYADLTGQVVIPAQYARAESFFEGVALVKGSTLINRKGETIAQLSGSDVRYNTYGGRVLFFEGGKRGYYDKQGQVVIKPKYQYYHYFHEQVSHAHLDGKHGFIDLRGKEFLPFEYDDAGDFEEGVAPVIKKSSLNLSVKAKGTPWEESPAVSSDMTVTGTDATPATTTSTLLLNAFLKDKTTGNAIEGEVFVRWTDEEKRFGVPVAGLKGQALPKAGKVLVTAKAKGYIEEQTELLVTAEKPLPDLVLMLEKLEIGKVVTLKNILFEQSQAVLLAESYPELDKLLRILQDNPTMEIKMLGHTDYLGNAQKNLQLSHERVQTLKNYLVEKGISASRISGEGFGGSKPLYQGNDMEKRKENRRVEFVVLR